MATKFKFIIYKFTLADKVYIGSTSNYERRKVTHRNCEKNKKGRHIRKYGWFNIKWEVLDEVYCSNTHALFLEYKAMKGIKKEDLLNTNHGYTNICKWCKKKTTRNHSKTQHEQWCRIN